MTNWVTLLKQYTKAVDDLTKAAAAGDLASIKDILLDNADSLKNVIGVETSKTLGNTYDKAKALDDLTKAAGDGDLAAVKTAVDLITAAGPTKAEMDTAHGLLATVAKQDVIDGYHDVPAVDGAPDVTIRDVVGKKTDTVAGTSLVALIKQVIADSSELQVSLADGGFTDLLIDAITTHLTDIKGVTWSDETLVAIKAAIDTISGVNTYQEQIPDSDFALAEIDSVLTANPPAADAENSVVDIDAIADPATTFVLRSLWVNVTSVGTGTKIIFKLWLPINGTITEVDSVEVAATGIKNLMDLFGLQEVHGDSIHITAQTDTGETGAVSGTYKYAKAV